jgi:hypothetical protein
MNPPAFCRFESGFEAVLDHAGATTAKSFVAIARLQRLDQMVAHNICYRQRQVR